MLTAAFCALVVALVVLFDLAAWRLRRPDLPTISHLLYRWSQRRRWLPYLVAYLCGLATAHFFGI